MQPDTEIPILLTRPLAGADRFASALRDAIGQHLNIVKSPLLQIEWIDGSPDLAGIRALVFTSINGVQGFIRQSARRDIGCFTVGDATAKFAESQGMNATSCSGNAEDLIARILAEGEKGPVLHVRGEHGRGAVVDNLNAAGCEAREIIVYRQASLMLNSAAKHLLETEKQVIVPLFSPRSAKILGEQYKGSAGLIVIALSGEVAKNTARLPLRKLVISARPDAAAMIGAIKGLSGVD